MKSPTISYEQPLHERLRCFLRLEFLFHQIKRYMALESSFDSHLAINSLLAVLNFVAQQDLKKEALKELDRINVSLSRLQKSPKIEQSTLNDILEKIAELRTRFRDSQGPIGNSLRDDEFIKVLLQRSAAPGGLTLFDPPAYSFWLHQPPEIRINDLTEWFSNFLCLDESVSLVLNLIRESAVPHARIAQGGIYQQALDAKTPYQMISVNLPRDSIYFAEISGGKHRFTVRFYDTTTKPRPMATTDDVEFQLSCCVL